MEQHIKIVGVLLILLALLHMGFPKYFKWKGELNGVSHINKQMMYIHTLFIALMVLLIGLLCFTSSSAIVGTALGKRISFGLGIFWTIRLFTQFFGYSPSLWKGKTFETMVHVIFSILWTYFSIIFIANYFD